MKKKKSDIQSILRAARLNAPELARLSGLSLDTVRSLLSGRRQHPWPSTRAKLAAALRSHGDNLHTLADQLSRP